LVFMSRTGLELGTMKEDNVPMAIISSLTGIKMPQTYKCEFSGATVGEFRQSGNPFVFNLDLEFAHGTEGIFDRRLGIAAAVLMGIVRKKGSLNT